MSKKRSRAREFAVQALYQWQLSGNAIKDIIEQFHVEKKPKIYEMDYFDDLVRGVVTDPDALDAFISPFIDRGIEQVDPVERAILRMATYELKHRIEIPYRVVINEAVELAKIFGADKSHKYINGVTDKIAQQLRTIEVKAKKTQSS